MSNNSVMKTLFWALGILAVIMLSLWYRNYTDDSEEYYYSAPKIERVEVEQEVMDLSKLGILPSTGRREY